MKGVYIFLADGFEDIEALGTRDILKRAGIDVQLVGITEDPFVVSSHGLMVGIDCSLADLEESYGASEGDVMVFPGGMPGARNLGRCTRLVELMKDHYSDGGTLAAICAAPGLVLSQLDDLWGIDFTCYDGFEDPMRSKGATFTARPAVTCGRIITGRGPGHTEAFALEMVRKVKGEAVAAEVQYGMDLICE